MPQQSLLQAASPAAHKLEALRQLFPQAVEVDPDGRVRVNAALLQLALDPANPAGIRVEEDGYELRWVGKREAYHSAFVPAQKIVKPLAGDSVNWTDTGNLLLKGDNLDALRLLRQSYFGQVKLIYIDPPYTRATTTRPTSPKRKAGKSAAPNASFKHCKPKAYPSATRPRSTATTSAS